MLALALILGVAWGLAAAAQSPTNANLGLKVGVAQATFVSFFGGTLLLAVLTVVFGSGNLGLVWTVPKWQIIGGLYGAFIVFSVTFSSPNLGVALTLTLVMLGQLIGGMAVDQWGFAGAEVIPASPLRMAGCLVAFVGLIFFYKGTKLSGKGGSSEAMGKRILCALLSFAGGVAGTFQASTNACLGQNIGLIDATLVNFIGGTIVALIAALIANRGRFKSFKGAKPWMFLGGAYGAFGVFCSIVATPVLGVAMLMAVDMLGQLFGGMAVDALGLFAVRKMKINRWRFAGACVLLVGVVLVTVARLV